LGGKGREANVAKKRKGRRKKKKKGLESQGSGTIQKT